MAKEIKFNVKLTVDGKEQLVTATLQSKRPTTGTVRLWVFCFNIHHSKALEGLYYTPFQGLQLQIYAEKR